MQQLIKIVAIVVDTKQAIVYKEDGSTLVLLQGDPRLRPLVDYATPLLIKQGWAEVDLSTPNHFKEFEEKSKGIRFFKIAKEKLKSFFGKSETVDPTQVGSVPTQPDVRAAVEKIIQHATPVKDPAFNEETVAEQRPTAIAGRTPNDTRTNDGKEEYFDKAPDTIVAVTKSGKIVPGIERIKSQFANAVSTGDVKGLEIFLERLGRVINDRRHSVEDLLRFMERGDLPVAADGSIVIYKKLYRQGEGFVDPYTKRVKQRIGSFVHMDESLVDPNRRNECSNGLHVARRGYVGNFNGDAIVLAKVRPEDVIAVPEYDANKMRVCGYHIVAELTPAQYAAINQNRPITDAAGGGELLAKVIAGDHIGIIEKVKITEHMGGGVVITPVSPTEGRKPARKAKKPATVKKDLARRKKAKAKKKVAKRQQTAKTLEAASKATDTPVNVKQVAAKVADPSVSLAVQQPAKLTQTDVVQALWTKALAGDRAAAKELLAFKKAAKKGWKVWGLPATAGDTLKALDRV